MEDLTETCCLICGCRIIDSSIGLAYSKCVVCREYICEDCLIDDTCEICADPDVVREKIDSLIREKSELIEEQNNLLNIIVEKNNQILALLNSIHDKQ